MTEEPNRKPGWGSIAEDDNKTDEMESINIESNETFENPQNKMEDLPSGFEIVKNSKRRMSGESGPSPNSNQKKKENVEKENTDRLLTIFLKGESEDITKKNPIKLYNFLKKHDTTLKTFQIQKSNYSLKINCENETQQNNIKQIKQILGVNVLVTEHYATNKNSEANLEYVIIFGVSLEVTEEEIKEETKANYSRRLFKKSGTDREPSSSVVLGFDSLPTPTHIYIGYKRHTTKQYIPLPVRCFNCQRYGHTSKYCKSSTACPRCSGNHNIKECIMFLKDNPTDSQTLHENEHSKSTNILKCRNCGGAHSAAFRNCPEYVKAAKATEIKTKLKISYSDALKKVKEEDQKETERKTLMIQEKCPENMNNPSSEAYCNQIHHAMNQKQQQQQQNAHKDQNKQLLIQENPTQQKGQNIVIHNTSAIQQDQSQCKTVTSNQVHSEHAYSNIHKSQTTTTINPRHHLFNQNTIPVQGNQKVENIILLITKIVSILVDNINEEKMKLVQNTIKTFFQSNDDLEETNLDQSSIC